MFLGITRSTLASHICSTDSVPWVHHSREEGSLDNDRRFVLLQVYLKFNTIIHCQQLRGSRVMSGDWQRLHRVCGVSNGSPENHWVPWLIHKAKTEEPKTVVQQHQTGGYRSDWCVTTQSGDFEAEDTRRDRKACVEAKQGCGRWAFVRWSDDKDFRIHPRGACIPN
jgi:hypothetical protein